MGPEAPWAPVAPTAPTAPVAPSAPEGPVGPVGPMAVGSTRSSCPGLKSTASREWFFTFALVTDPLRNCAVPTEFLGNFAAAYPPPAAATTSAIIAMTIAGDGLWVWGMRFFTAHKGEWEPNITPCGDFCITPRPQSPARGGTED